MIWAEGSRHAQVVEPLTWFEFVVKAFDTNPLATGNPCRVQVAVFFKVIHTWLMFSKLTFQKK